MSELYIPVLGLFRYPSNYFEKELIKPKRFVYAASLTDKAFTSNNIVKKLSDLFRILKPYDDFFNFTLEEHPELAVRSLKRR